MVKIRDAIVSVAPDGTDQIIYYSKGVGSTGNKVRRLLAGAFGSGVAADVRNAYGFLVQNYQAGDEIFLFGFSRGAYTARSVAGMIRTVGILPKAKAELTPEAWRIYRIPDPVKKADKPEAVKFRAEHICRMAPINFIGVWDTVGALGVPVGRIIRRWSQARHSFHDTGLSSTVKNACHALAIDEGRYTFEAALSQQKPAENQKIAQVWLCGAHSNVGGGYPDTGLSDIAFLWMAEKAAACGLSLELSNVENVNASSSGKLVDSRWLKWLPGNLREVGAHPEWGESVHPTVLERQRAKDADPSPYKPRNYPGPRSGAPCSRKRSGASSKRARELNLCTPSPGRPAPSRSQPLARSPAWRNRTGTSSMQATPINPGETRTVQIHAGAYDNATGVLLQLGATYQSGQQERGATPRSNAARTATTLPGSASSAG